MPTASAFMESALPKGLPFSFVPPPSLDRATIAAHADLRPVLRIQASALLAVHRRTPRVAAIFGKQQRYLLGQLAIAMAFEGGERGLIVAHFLQAVKTHGISSRNTATSFIEEMLHYKIARINVTNTDRRRRPVVLTAATIEALTTWLALHLRSLDALDGGNRQSEFERHPQLLAQVHPLIVHHILLSEKTMPPARIFSFLGEMNDGGLLMDNIIASLQDAPAGTARFPTLLNSFSQLSEPLRVSRTHLLRKLAVSEQAGHLGWLERRGASTFWISKEFLHDYEIYQVEKLANIETAWQAVRDNGRSGHSGDYPGMLPENRGGVPQWAHVG